MRTRTHVKAGPTTTTTTRSGGIYYTGSVTVSDD